MTEKQYDMMQDIRFQQISLRSDSLEYRKLEFQLKLIGCDHTSPYGTSTILNLDTSRFCRICSEYFK